jgi:rubredoxin
MVVEQAREAALQSIHRAHDGAARGASRQAAPMWRQPVRQRYAEGILRIPVKLRLAARLTIRGQNARVIELKKECVVSEVIIEYKSWVCLICGWIYNEEEGLPEEGIPAGTRFADIPEDWRCPLCDVGKAEFAVVEF